MRGVEKSLASWAISELKYWEQAALEKLSRQGGLSDENLQVLVQYFIEDAGLARTPADRPSLSILKKAIGLAELAPCRLNKIFNLRNVNALPEGQEITFGPQLTLLYGNNGAGKSGYARTLASAGFARGERSVLPNAKGIESKERPQADFEVCYETGKQVVTWTAGESCPQLSGFYVFDGSSLPAHLSGSNPLRFTPVGLSLLTKLAETTDLVRQKIRILIDEHNRPHNLLALFDGESDVKNQLTNLEAGTNLETLRGLAHVSPDDEKSIAALDKEVAQIKLLDPSRLLARRQQEISDLEALVEAIQTAQTEMSATAVADVNDLIRSWHDLRAAVEKYGVSQFEFPLFSTIGTDAWRKFVVAAKALAEAEGQLKTPYPTLGDPCLLCRQTLSVDAVDLINKLWLFLQSDAQSRLLAAENACGMKLIQLERLNVNYFAADSNARRVLEDELQLEISALDAHLESCRELCGGLKEALRSRVVQPLPPLIICDTTNIKRLIALRNDDLKHLQTSTSGQRLAKAEKSLRELKHRQILAQRFSEVSSYVARRKWAAAAHQCLGSTRLITNKYNELFEELVTDHYTTLFEETLKRFRREGKVTMETRGSKGETLRHLILSPTSYRVGYSIDQILSEGEQRAVAMADFLTEAAVDQNNSGIILDDPVTSMDDEWKRTLADCVAELAQTRQVVIFTHDLTFLHRIKERAEVLSVDVVTHWIKEEHGQPGFVYQNNSPVCEKDFRSAAKAREHYSQSLGASPAEQQNLLEQGFAALRSSYEALIIFEVFNEVIVRFDDRLRVDNLKQVRLDPVLVNKIVDRVGTLSRYIGAHLHSDKFGSVKPSPVNLLEEIETFESIRRAQRELKKTQVNVESAKIANIHPLKSQDAPQDVNPSKAIQQPREPSTN